MARLSVNDLNNLSGISDDELKNLYNTFREAHTKLFNDINNWVVQYETISCKLDNIAGTTEHNDYIVYKKAKELYYIGNIILDDVDLFDNFTREYQSLLCKLNNKGNTISEILPLLSLLTASKKKIINRLSECYGLYSEAYERLYEEE